MGLEFLSTQDDFVEQVAIIYTDLKTSTEHKISGNQAVGTVANPSKIGVLYSKLDVDIVGNFDHLSDFHSDGFVYFGADDGTNGHELWRSDGSTTELVSDIQSGSGNSHPSNLISHSDSFVYFSADDGTSGHELWRSDGSTTELVSDIQSGSGDSSPSNFVLAQNSNLYFIATNASGDSNLYEYDGLTVTRVLTTDFMPCNTYPETFSSMLNTLSHSKIIFLFWDEEYLCPPGLEGISEITSVVLS